MDRRELGQLINLVDGFVAVGRPNRPGTRIAPRFITIHNTSNSNAGANARAHMRFIQNTGHYMLNGRKNWVSWHYSVDDREAIRHVPINEKALHAGPGNAISIAIEVCMHAGIDQAAANLRAQRLSAALMFDLRLGADALRTHKSWTGKACPALLLPQWAGFVAQSAAIRAQVSAPEGAPFEPMGTIAPEAAEPAGADFDDAEIDHEALGAALDGYGEGEGR